MALDMPARPFLVDEEPTHLAFVRDSCPANTNWGNRCTID